jgi:hypothetical protein
MKNAVKPSAEILDLPLEVRADLAMKAAFQKLVEEHARDGRPVYVWCNGKVVEMSAEEMRAYSSRDAGISQSPWHTTSG